MKVSRMAVVAALSLSALAVAAAGTARAATSATSPGVVSTTISSAAQAATLAYWTPARMEAATPPGPSTSTPAVTAHSFSGLRSVGALFYTTGGKAHFCTASVINSKPRNILLTAAHCVYGNSGFAQNIAFVPEYHAGKKPYGMYTVESIFITGGWEEGAAISQDFSFLAVKGAVQNRVGAALNLGINKPTSQKVVSIGYNDTSSSPIWCPTKSFQPKGLPSQMEFQCDGFWIGTSGGPWIEGSGLNADGTVFGDIGGYEQGGNSPNWSYSPKFTALTEQLYDFAISRA
jgi:V8-like Glu-specific endopeptidase